MEEKRRICICQETPEQEKKTQIKKKFFRLCPKNLKWPKKNKTINDSESQVVLLCVENIHPTSLCRQ